MKASWRTFNLARRSPPKVLPSTQSLLAISYLLSVPIAAVEETIPVQEEQGNIEMAWQV
jgi:hypothetical protein